MHSSDALLYFYGTHPLIIPDNIVQSKATLHLMHVDDPSLFYMQYRRQTEKLCVITVSHYAEKESLYATLYGTFIALHTLVDISL